MSDINYLEVIRNKLEESRGERVWLKTNQGRKKSCVKEGVIHNTYPSIFTVKVKNGSGDTRILSYTYSDLLTSNVELVLCKNNRKI